MKVFKKVMLVIFIGLMSVLSCRTVFSSQTKTLIPIADSYVSNVQPNSNYGGESGLLVINNYREEDIVFIMFNLTEIPSDTSIISVKLRLFTKFVLYSFNISVFLCPNNDWSESNITWANKPSFSVDALDSVVVDREDKWYEWNVTFPVKFAHMQNDKRVSFVLKSDFYPTQYGIIEFASKEHQKYSPQLVIEYEGETDTTLPDGIQIMIFVVSGCVGIAIFTPLFFRLEERFKEVLNKKSEKTRRRITTICVFMILLGMISLFLLLIYISHLNLPFILEWIIKGIIIMILAGASTTIIAHAKS